ncbi:hypothetical protein V3C99_001376, partial [Haemonchus contortus]
HGRPQFLDTKRSASTSHEETSTRSTTFIDGSHRMFLEAVERRILDLFKRTAPEILGPRQKHSEAAKRRSTSTPPRPYPS